MKYKNSTPAWRPWKNTLAGTVVKHHQGKVIHRNEGIKKLPKKMQEIVGGWHSTKSINILNHFFQNLPIGNMVLSHDIDFENHAAFATVIFSVA